ncbi:hypothetical protein LV84_03990 [Algoriphagus ratkowskyi]|uniref:Uncharacterized protein n=1 Tax=Algoriphagus ratkowskyi TaxID=57028 RepID=A0A2W7QQ57_9BACT|nr:hypothetical protein [Algoriphagus ratkowskyi]PZX50678.1 hypothetical protein LV84_03990 [Algoriphagus ratkowskyi]TXD80032.1 hypothetical protein ESW18_02590 [Algoriphagus ratkowskyi]
MKTNRTVLSILLLVLSTGVSLACEVCKSKQPKGFEDITHGSGPGGNLDYFIVWGAAIIVTITLGLSLKFLIKPQENRPDHIKNSILDNL